MVLIILPRQRRFRVIFDKRCHVEVHIQGGSDAGAVRARPGWERDDHIERIVLVLSLMDDDAVVVGSVFAEG